MAAQLAYPDQEIASQSASIPAPEYVCFSRLPIFSATASRKPLASPKLASAWADAILGYWQSGIANGGIDQNKPLYLLDMAPQNGDLAWLLQGELLQRLTALGLELSSCYLSCYEDAASAEYHAGHPYFRDDIAAGRKDFAYWDKACSTLYLHQQKKVLQRSDNPLVVLGLGYFQTLASELIGIHNGKILQANATVTHVSVDLESYEFAYQWRAELAQVDSENVEMIGAPLLARYRQHCNDSTFTLPLRACEMLDVFNRFANDRVLLLAADSGVSNVQQIRMGGLCPPASWRIQDAAPPVNFDALNLYQQQRGAWVWQQQLDVEGLVMQMAWRDDARPIPRQFFNRAISTLADAHPDDIQRLAAMQHNSVDTLTLLRLSHYDPQFLKASITALIEQPLTLTDSARRNWQTALLRTWCHFLPSAVNDGFYYQMGLLAVQVGHLGLAKECFRLGLAWYGDEANDLYLLAWCEASSGGVANAQTLLARALALQPEHPQSLALQATLQERLERWRQNIWYLPTYANSTTSSLRLEPIGDEHTTSLLYQYRDRQIGVMTRLPEMETLEQAQIWIGEQQQESGRACFAVMHECWGFVGLVSIHCAGSAGYFYFWIGSDFQEQGLGQQAAQLLFEIVAQQGVTEIFTSAYEDNLRSIHALTRLGFATLTLRARGPDMTLKFFYLARREIRTDDEATLGAALIELCSAIGSPLQLI
jgi:RimJ/RimL family protein N-acetyltransferase